MDVRNLLRKIKSIYVPKIALDLYDKVARAASGKFYSKLAIQIAKIVKRKKVKKILDIGTGSGYLPINIARRTEKVLVFGIDIDEKMIERARENAAELGIPPNKVLFSVIDAQKLPFKNDEFEFIVSTGVLREVENPAKMFDEIYRVLKKGEKVESEAWVYDFCRDAKDSEIKRELNEIDKMLKANKMEKSQRDWIELIRKREITIKSYSEREILSLLENSKFKNYTVERDGVWIKIVLKK